MNVSRRRMIAFGVGGAALLAIGGVLRAATRSYPLPKGAVPPLALSVKELVVVRAIIEALQPGDGAFPSGLSLGVDRVFDEELYSLAPDAARDFKDALQLLEHAPPLVGSWGRLTELDVQARADVLEKLKREGPDVVVFSVVAIQQLASIFLFGQPATWAAIGYDGPWQKEPKPHDSHARYLHALAVTTRDAR